MGCAYIAISYDVVDGLIATAIDAGDSTYCAQDAADVLISDIDSEDSMGCADITVSDDVADGLTAAAIYDGDAAYCAEYATDGLIDDIDSVYFMDCTDMLILYDVTYVLIAISVDLTDCSGTNVSYDSVDVLMMLMC